MDSHVMVGTTIFEMASLRGVIPVLASDIYLLKIVLAFMVTGTISGGLRKAR